jgi:hypothetical protein
MNISRRIATAKLFSSNTSPSPPRVLGLSDFSQSSSCLLNGSSICTASPLSFSG